VTFSGGQIEPTTNQVYFQNVLASGIQWVVWGDGLSLSGENVTADSINIGFAIASTEFPGSSYTGAFTNSIFTAVGGGFISGSSPRRVGEF